MDQKWPKQLPVLTEEQQRIKSDFMKYWHEVLPKKYGLIEKFNHGYPVKHSTSGGKILEIGAGLGEHIEYEDLSKSEYYALELLPSMAQVIKERFPHVNVVVGDCQKRTEFSDNFFDRANAIHVLEHLPDLPAALVEIHRVLKPGGEFAVVIPCEGGLAYTLARRISAQRIFEKRYKTKYDWCIGSEHINVPKEMMEEIEKKFTIKHRTFFPLHVPITTINLVIGMILEPKK
jgi:ubiquinone/menaquinone biosynthesis C-methylase UbiE